MLKPMNNKDILKRTCSISFLIIIIDQLIKIIISMVCKNSDLEIIKNIFYFTKVENAGIAFSLNKNNLKNLIISSIIILFVFRYLFVNKKFLNPITVTSLSLIIGGGISNIIDRIFRNGVLDFISFGDFPIFNIADICIVFGWGMFAFYILKFEVKKK